MAAGGEEGGIDPERHFFDTGRIGAVEADELFGFDRRVGEDHVAAADRCRFGEGTILRLRVVGLRLHAGERVERDGQRDIEGVLENVPGLRRQPIVRMEHVGSDPVGGHSRFDRRGEVRDNGTQVLLGNRSHRTGDDVVHPKAGLNRDDRRVERGGGPGHDVAFHSGPGERGGEFTDVDVHAATVAGAGLCQRGRMQGEDDDAHALVEPGGKEPIGGPDDLRRDRPTNRDESLEP